MKRYFKLTTAPQGLRTEKSVTFIAATIIEGDEANMREEVISTAINKNLVHPDDYGDWNEELMTFDEITADEYYIGLRDQDDVE